MNQDTACYSMSEPKRSLKLYICCHNVQTVTACAQISNNKSRCSSIHTYMEVATVRGALTYRCVQRCGTATNNTAGAP